MDQNEFGPNKERIYLNLILNTYFVNLWLWIDENSWIRKQGIDEICYGSKKIIVNGILAFFLLM